MCIINFLFKVAQHYNSTDICITIFTGHGSCIFPGRYDSRASVTVFRCHSFPEYMRCLINVYSQSLLFQLSKSC